MSRESQHSGRWFTAPLWLNTLQTRSLARILTSATRAWNINCAGTRSCDSSVARLVQILKSTTWWAVRFVCSFGSEMVRSPGWSYTNRTWLSDECLRHVYSNVWTSSRCRSRWSNWTLSVRLSSKSRHRETNVNSLSTGVVVSQSPRIIGWWTRYTHDHHRIHTDKSVLFWVNIENAAKWMDNDDNNRE